MPTAPKRACWKAYEFACPNDEPCPTHPRPVWRSQGGDNTPYNNAAWRRLRASVLAEEPTCRACGIADATDVDHIDGNASNMARSNLQPLCKPCHSRKTARTLRR